MYSSTHEKRGQFYCGHKKEVVEYVLNGYVQRKNSSSHDASQ